MRRTFVIWMALLLSAMADLSVTTATLPPLPVNGIYDPDRWLEGDAIEEVERRITGAREKGNTSVFVVIFSEVPGDQVESFAMRLGRAWAHENLWGMVFHVPGDDTYPKFFGELNRTPDWSEHQLTDFQDSIDQALVEATKRSKWQDDVLLQIESGTRVMADEFGYLGLVLERMDHNNAQARGDRFSEEEEQGNEGRGVGSMLLIGIPLVLFSVVVLGFLLVRKSEEDGDDYHFPETSPRKRFLAPWSGGGNVLVHFDSPAGEENSRRRS